MEGNFSKFEEKNVTFFNFSSKASDLSLLAGHLWSWATVQILLLSAGIFNNVLILFSVVRHREIRSFLNVLFANFAVACLAYDLCVEVVHVATTLLEFYSWLPVMDWYRYYLYVNTLFSLSINLSICSVCVNRFIAVLYPEHYIRSRTIKSVVKCVIIPCWTLSLLGCLLAAVLEGAVSVTFTFSLNICGSKNVNSRIAASILDNIFLFLPTALMALCFFNIAVKTYLATPRTHPLPQLSFSRRLKMENENAIVKRHAKHSRSVLACVLTWIAVTYPPALLCWRERSLAHGSTTQSITQLWMTVLRPLGTVLYPVKL
jgi:hypothetical protein